jgi:hypothetical protein
VRTLLQASVNRIVRRLRAQQNQFAQEVLHVDGERFLSTTRWPRVPDGEPVLDLSGYDPEPKLENCAFVNKVRSHRSTELGPVGGIQQLMKPVELFRVKLNRSELVWRTLDWFFPFQSAVLTYLHPEPLVNTAHALHYIRYFDEWGRGT